MCIQLLETQCTFVLCTLYSLSISVWYTARVLHSSLHYSLCPDAIALQIFFHTEQISTVASPKLKVQENLKTSQCSTVVRNSVVRAVMKVIGWEIPDFGPPSSLTPGAIDLKFGTVVYVRGTTPHAKNGKNWPSRVALAQGWNIMFKGFLKNFGIRIERVPQLWQPEFGVSVL